MVISGTGDDRFHWRWRTAVTARPVSAPRVPLWCGRMRATPERQAAGRRG
jgi:hypothetical protein